MSMTADWVMDELDRDLHALWRFFGFLHRTGRQTWDPDQAAEVIGEYARDEAIWAAIAACPYHQIDGLWPTHRPAQRKKGETECYPS